MIFRVLWIASALTIFLGSCDSAKKTEKGIAYNFRKNTENPSAKKDEVITFHINIFNDKDSLLGSSYQNGRPFVYKIGADPSLAIIDDIMMLCGEGDSISFKVPSDSLPQGFADVPKGSMVRFELSMLKVQTEEVFMKEAQAEDEKRRTEMMEKMAAQKEIDDQTIQKYLADNNIKAQKTASGLYYTITKTGKGATPTKGKKVKVHYTGTLLDGTKFDSSLDRGQPFEFPLGEGQVIQGWDEGIALLNKGAKATLFIPSVLGYGAQGVGSIIPPFAVLKFDVELLEF